MKLPHVIHDAQITHTYTHTQEDMLSEVERAKKLVYSRRLEATLAVRAEDQEDDVLDAKDAGTVISNLGPYRPSRRGPLSKPQPASSPEVGIRDAPMLGLGLGAAGTETTSAFARRPVDEDRVRRRAEREKRRKRRFGKRGGQVVGVPGGGVGEKGTRELEGWSRSFPWSDEERVKIREALVSGGEESEGEAVRGVERVGKVLEAADMVMEDVDDDVKVCMYVLLLFSCFFLVLVHVFHNISCFVWY